MKLLDINPGERPSQLELGRRHSGELPLQGTADEERFAAAVRESAPSLTPFDWEVLRKAAVRAQEAEAPPPVTRRPWWQFAWIVPVLVAALALVVVRLPDDPSSRAKGDADLEFYVLQGEQVLPGIEGYDFSEGDRLQFTYRTTGLDSMVLLSIDGDGTLTVFYPASGDEPVPIIPGERHVLDGSIKLDGAPGPEVFVAVFGPGSVEEARELVKDAYDAGSHDGIEALGQRDPAIDTIRIEKRLK